MHANEQAPTSDSKQRLRSPAKTQTPGGGLPLGLTALQASAGNAAVVQMLRQTGHEWAQGQHQHGAGCGRQQTEQPQVQRSAVHDVLRSGGRPLDDATRTDMESRLGADFSAVRIHTDSAAKASAAEVGAHAYTSGSHVVIGDGGGDKHTLAHELTHVIQQRQGPVAGTDNGAGLKVSDPSDRFEREAEANATRVMSTAGVQRSAASTPSAGTGCQASSGPVPDAAAVQRTIKVTADGYAQAKGLENKDALTRPQVMEYLKVAVFDDYRMAAQYSKDGDASLKARFEAVISSQGNGVAELDLLIAEVNNVMERDVPAEYRANKNTRYHVDPQGGYKHQSLGVRDPWANDEAMWDQFGQGLGQHAQDATETVGRVGNEPLKQLTWDQAKRLLPRPLINLIFDVRFQLESGALIDERTPNQLARQDATPNEPGTLRSWHQDDTGRLPSHGADHRTGATQFGDQVPEESRTLHNHYNDHSQSGTGSAIQTAADFPRGFAEYTGTGSNFEHNTKVVLDYIQKRVYLTLTHYQYWGLAQANGRSHFIPSGTQDAAQAAGIITGKMPGLKIPAGTPYQLMNPWVQILA
ncbi:DUF4157 domain-containing protein [Streptomyces sp. WM6378]|uniref:eCIS core domain-containing protein n=1 Tax=Streptomyces sp. WM6378 TaxID=1415557 RepID=UPI00099BC8FA|nr:DUF4157 domain-containing protein [Streptomyces sp. WM6378]